MLTRMHQERSRGSTFFRGSVLALALGAVSCGEGDVEFGAVHPNAAPPIVEFRDDVRVVLSTDAQSSINFRAGVPNQPRLLFMESRAAVPLGEGRVGWTDADGARGFVFDSRGVVEAVLQGAPKNGLPPTSPWWVVAIDGGLHVVEAGGRELRFESGGVSRWIEPAFAGPRVGSFEDRSVAARSIMNFDLRPLPAEAPLLWLAQDGEEGRGIGDPLQNGQAFLGPLANTGWAAIDARGIVFASALEPLLRQYQPDGSLDWEARWTPEADFPTPRFRAVRGAAEPDFTLAQYAVALGPRGHVHVLAASAPDTGPNTLLVFDREGGLVARGTVPEGAAVLADDNGHLYLADPEDVLNRSEATTRPLFPDFDLESLDGDRRVSLQALRGRVSVVNFWASWCAPCRREIPVLSEMAQIMDTGRVAVVGLNEDVRPADGRAFLEELGGVVYPSGMGRGDLRNVYGYRGLPFTVIIDPDGRVVRTLYGFGEDLDGIREIVEAELERLQPGR